jgi:hypothetical protein
MGEHEIEKGSKKSCSRKVVFFRHNINLVQFIERGFFYNFKNKGYSESAWKF